jgi:aminomethyltransferase
MVTRRVTDMNPGQVRYALVTNEQGGILDDVLVYRFGDTAGQASFLVVANAGNRVKIGDWLRRHLSAETEVAVDDQTRATAMIAVQGPRALSLAQPIVAIRLAEMKYYSAAQTEICGARGHVSRTGYTGEDGCELIVPASAAVEVWERLWRAGESVGAAAAGLGARDTLRLEAGMPLYGHELSEAIDPMTADLAFAVNLEGREFCGREAIARRAVEPGRWRRVGLVLCGKRAARQGYPILEAGTPVGRITSGSFSPTLDRPIAMGYVPERLAAVGTRLEVDLRGRAEAAEVVPLPFYRRPRTDRSSENPLS